jgi:glycosyltransferase involved in cell wall biosynthesis
MNICYVCNEYPEGPHGGVGTITQLLAEELTLRKNSVKVIGVYDLSYPAAAFEIRNGVEITRVKVNCRSKIAIFHGNLKIARIIRRWIKNDLVDIIESPDSYGVFSLFARFKKPLVLRAHGNNMYFSSILNIPVKRQTVFYERNLYRKANGFCAVSAFTAEKVKAMYKMGSPVTVIHNGIELRNYNEDKLTLTDDVRYLSSLTNPVVFSGTLAPKKGIYQLVESVLLLIKKGIDVTLIVNGKDSINSKTGESVKHELLKIIPPHLTGNFIFNGHVTRNEILTQYKYSKAAIFPSFAEAFAVAPMEAMAIGIPTIFSKECSGSELINNMEDGLLIDPSSVESIAGAIEYFLLNPAKASQIGQKGKEKINLYFSKQTMTTNTISFYEQVQRTFYNK